MTASDTSRGDRRLLVVIREWSWTKLVLKYSAVSLIAVAIGQVMLAIAFDVLKWSAVRANLFAFVVSAFPSYYLNRAWTWEKRGRSKLVGEILPFWVISLLGLALSTWTAHLGETWGRHLTGNRNLQTLIVMFAALFGFGIVWVVKLLVLHRLFRPEPPATLENASPP